MHVRWVSETEERRSTIDTSKEIPSPVAIIRHPVIRVTDPNFIDQTEKARNPRDSRKSEPPESTDLYQALFPIYHLTKLCGLVPVRLVKLENGRYQGHLSLIDIIYSVCLLITLVGLQSWGLWRDMKDGMANSIRLKSRTASIATFSDILAIIGLTTVAILGSPFRWKYLQIVMDKLVEVDEKIGFVAPKKTRRFTISMILVSLTYLTLASCLDIYAWDVETKDTKRMRDKGPINYSPLYAMYVVMLLMEIQYGVSAYNVGQRFARLNNSLENILNAGKFTDCFRRDLGLASDFRESGTLTALAHEPTLRMFRKTKVLDFYPTSTPTANDDRSYADIISELVPLHSSLCDTVACINSAYGVALLVMTLTCLLHLVISPYFLILEADGRQGELFFLVQILWCVLHVGRMLMIVQPTYSTVTEAKKTAIVVSQLLYSSPELEARKQLEIFSLQLLHRPLNFSACGLFSLDRALVTSMAGAVTTYLVILIQFQKADDTKGDADVIRNVSQILKNASSSLHNFTAIKFG